MTTLRDELEDVIRSWNAYEVERGCAPVVDFDFHPRGAPARPAPDRLHVHGRLRELAEAAFPAGEPLAGAETDRHRDPDEDGDWVTPRLRADLAYLGALLGERVPLDRYVQDTQGCSATGWPADHVNQCLDRARESLDVLAIGWDEHTADALHRAERPIPGEHAVDAIHAATAELEPAVRAATGTRAPYRLSVQSVDVDAYWSYWLDGTGPRIRLRLNTRNARFTEVGARQFALHEVLGHGLQGASFADRCRSQDVPWVRVLSVHGPTQVLLEGLAQALPLLVLPDDLVLVARVRLEHYLQLVRAELHLAVNAGTPVTECAAHARSRVPFWTDRAISDLLADRGANPQLRSYLWAYPAGLDWFAALFDDATPDVVASVLSAAYRDPLTPARLARLWPQGPRFGGYGARSTNGTTAVRYAPHSSLDGRATPWHADPATRC